jgi:hypothetical protein
MRRTSRLAASFVTVATAAALAVANAPAAQAAVPLQKVIDDPFTGGSGEHKASVEPDTFAFGNTIVVAAQVGREFAGGGTGIGYATSTDAGATWTQGTLPGITTATGGPYERVSDSTVAYDAAHGVWLIASIPLTASLTIPAVIVNRSTDGGLTFGNPIAIASSSTFYDKDWIVCDNHPTSPYYGHCYAQFDDHANKNLLEMSTSTDGGLTWGPALTTGNKTSGFAGQPVVQPNGTVVVVAISSGETEMRAWRSLDGGVSWTSTIRAAALIWHPPAGNLRSGALPSAEIDAAGNVYVAWQDCRFRAKCTSNDIVMSTSSDGKKWTAPSRVPIDATSSGFDHFIPGLAVDPATSGGTAKLGLTYYFYRNAACGTDCQLEVGYLQSGNGGASWSAPTDVAGPFSISLCADTSEGRMVGDYISTSWVGGRAFGAFAVGQAPSVGYDYDEAIYVPSGGIDQ